VFLLLAAASVFFSGCDAGRGLEAKAEVSEPHYVRGLQMVRSGQNQVALEAFLKVIEKRNGDAPESHLEAGRIYLNHIRDPIAAIYHFRRHLELKPNGPQAQGVRQLIETAKKEFARTLPGNPLGDQVDRVDLLETIETLKAQNARLLAALEAAGNPATAGQGYPQTVAQGQPQSPPRRPAAQSLPEDLPVQPVVPVETAPAQMQPTRPVPGRSANVTTAGVTSPQTGAPTPPAGRTYTVQAGDTLYKISVKAYGTGSRWPAILDANRDQLRSERDVKPGMTLRLP
jgi:LysM repeat protein